MQKIAIIIMSLLLLSACNEGKSQSLEEFYKDASIENVDKVIIQDGSTGESIEITEEVQITEFLLLINEIYFTPQENQEGRVGWRYGITLFDGPKKFQFTLSQIEDTYYDSTPDIYPIVDAYYKKQEND
ncbi:hypothetical protein ACFOZY_14270 [Chungangia koreensis]|uniref:Lipoprotein n=1 Tax=Chungangia koreensis TaxID=752657 RepID=A0ABV8X9E3_9LACT